MNRHSDWASRYIERYRLALVEIPHGHKAPLHSGWNKPGGYVTDPEVARQHWGNLPDHGIGAVLAPSGLCSLDVDSPKDSEPLLAELGVDLRALRESNPTIQGHPSRYRIMFRAPEGLDLHAHKLIWPSNNGAKPITLFELRAGPVQDVLPPTIHPGTKKPYTWLTKPGDDFPSLPAALLELWTNWDSYRPELEGACPWGRDPFKPAATSRGNGARADVIGAFNQAHTAEELLKAHGYKQRGKRWTSPTSESDLAGVVILDGRVFSHHASDPLNDGHSHDAFDVYRILDHGGDLKAAVKAAALALGISPTAGAEPQGRDEHQPGTENAQGGEDVIEDAIAKLAEDVGAAFEPDVLAALKKARANKPADYQRYRKRIKAASLSVVELDRLTSVGGEGGEDTGQGQAFVIEAPEPWPDSVGGAELLYELAATFQRYVVLPEHADTALALWTVHTYSYDYGRCTPNLALTSPQKRCGKTTLLSVLLVLANKPLGASNISPSCVFRSIDRWQPTLLIDEADSFLRDNEELRGIINSGHTRELAYVIRNVGDDHEPRQFSTWCPKAIALIGKLPPTLHDRAIEIPLVRKTAAESVERLGGLDGADIRRKSVRWVSDHASELREADPVVPQELHDRAADNWRPLLAIADLAGGDWPKRARTAALALAKGDDDTESFAVMLLGDIRDLFEQRQVDKLFSEDIVEHLHTLEDRPWSQWGRSQKPIAKNQVARLLKPFKIKPGTKREGGTTSKGYELRNFKDAFSRYLPPIRSVTPSQSSNGAASGDFQTVTPENNVTDRKPLKPAPDIGCDGVTDQKGDTERIKRAVVL